MKSIIKKILLLSVISIFVLAIFCNVNVNADASDVIRTIFTNPGENSNSEIRINYHIDLEKSGSYVIYTEKDDSDWINSTKVMAEEIENNAFAQLNGSGEKFKQCGAVLSNLKPGTNYMYKVCLDNYESTVHYFKTGEQYFSFLWTSDFHTYYDNGSRLKNATATIEEAIKMNGGVDFVLSTGDTIAHGGTYKWWNQLSTASWINNYMFADTLGNHDWMTSKGTTVALGASHVFFGANHNNPKNGYESQENICYYFYYGDAIFICLNTEEFTDAQYNWCEEVLKNSEAQYKFIFQHYQMFNKSGSFNSTGYTRWHKLCDKYDVDIAFSGNSHVYLRSKSIYQGKLSNDKSKGTVYMVAPSSDGERGEALVPITSNSELVAKSWADKNSVATSVVNVRENNITIKLINKGGEILDTVTIPAKRGTSNRITKDISGIDKKSLEPSFKMSINGADLTKPYFNYAKEAFAAVKKVSIKDKNDGNVYYLGSLEEGRGKFKLDNFPVNKLLNLEIEVTYWDNEVYKFEQEFLNRKSFGTIDSFKIDSVTDNDLILSWNASLKAEEVKELNILINGKVVKTIAINEKKATISLTDLEAGKDNEISLMLIDTENNEIVTLKLNYLYKDKIVLSDLTIKNVSKDSFDIGDTIQLEVIKNPLEASDEIEWISSDESIATVNNGLVKFIKEGKVTITVRSKLDNSIKGTIELEAVKKELPPDVDPTPTPEPKPSGCNSGSFQFVWYTLSLLGLVIVLKKRFVK